MKNINISLYFGVFVSIKYFNTIDPIHMYEKILRFHPGSTLLRILMFYQCQLFFVGTNEGFFYRGGDI